MKTRYSALTLLFSLLLTSLVASAEGRHRDHRDSLLHAHDRLERALAFAGPVDGFLPHTTHDVVYLYPDQEALTGRQDIRTFLRTLYPRNTNVKTILHRIAADTSADGTLGYTIGWLEEITTGAAAPVTTYGRFIAMWRRHDHQWKVEAFLRQVSTTPLAAPPADALILDGERGVVRPALRANHEFEVALVDARFAELSVAEGYTVAFSTYTADAALIVTPGRFFYDRAGVEFAFGGWTPAEMLSWHPLRAEAAASGDLGWTIGYATSTFNDGQTSQVGYSKYLTVWIRTEDGWRFLMDGGNPRPADPDPTP